MTQDTQQSEALVQQAFDQVTTDEHTQLVDQAVNIARELTDTTNAAVSPIFKRLNDDDTPARAVLGGLASYVEQIMGAALSNLYANGVPMDVVEDTAEEIAENAMVSVRRWAYADDDAENNET